MNNKLKILLLIIICLPLAINAQNEAKLVRKGNKQYESKKYNDAEIDYRKAIDKVPQSQRALFNLGDALYKQESYEEAADVFKDLTQKQTSDELKAKAFHNLGNSKLKHALDSDTLDPQKKQEKYKESIEAYKNALKINPNDINSKYNLEYAKKKLVELQQQQQEQNKNNKDNKDKDKQDQDKKEQDKKDQDKKEQQEKEQKQEEKQQQQQEKEISKEDAERMLEALKNDEQNTLDKLQKKKVKVSNIKIDKDW